MSTDHSARLDIPPAELRENKRLEKELQARVRDCLDKNRDHIRVGDWIGEKAGPDEGVTHLGHARDLHGTVCTCCPKRSGAA